MIRIALYQPDIPQNAGAILRTAACFGLAVDLIHPAGFRLDARALVRAGLDYAERAVLTEHASYAAFRAALAGERRRLVLFTTSGNVSHAGFAFRAGDVLLFGRESAGVPEAVQRDADARVAIPIAAGMRSLNVSVAAGIAAAEALRQLGAQPPGLPPHADRR